MLTYCNITLIEWYLELQYNAAWQKKQVGLYIIMDNKNEHYSNKENIYWWVAVVHTFNPSTQEADLWVWGQSGL